MLRITTQEEAMLVTFVLEGKCRGAWVEELERCWRTTAASAAGRKLRVDLRKVGFVDDRGKELLTQMCTQGVQLVAAGPMMTSLVEEIAASCPKTVKQRA